MIHKAVNDHKAEQDFMCVNLICLSCMLKIVIFTYLPDVFNFKLHPSLVFLFDCIAKYM